MFAKRTNWDLRPNELSEALAKHRASGKPLIDLTTSNPTECGFKYDAEAILAAFRNPAMLKYEPQAKGLGSAREAVAEYYADRGDRVSPDDILLTTSTSEAYSWVFRLLCEAGDEVLVPAPSYPLFDFLADLQDARLVRYPLFYDHGWHFDFHALESAITPRTRAVMVVHPNNPAGNYSKPHEIERLNEICAARELAIVADEVFLDFALDGQRRASFATNGAGPGRPLTFTLSGLSKIGGLPQMKVAWIVVSGPPRAKADALARLEVIADTHLSMNAPIQLALPELLKMRHGFQRQLMIRIRENLAELDRQAASAQASCKLLAVEGGWCAVLRVRAIHAEDHFAIELLASRDVYIHPGHFYEFPDHGHIVVSLIVRNLVLREGLLRLFSCQ